MSILERRPELALRLGSTKAMKQGERITLCAPPAVVDGQLFIPRDALLPEWEPEGECTVGGAEYVTGAKGIYTNVDSMGLVMLDSDAEVTTLNHNEHKRYMCRLMAEFLFDIERVPMTAGVYRPATDGERAAYKRIGKDIYERLREGAPKRPYILTSPKVIANLRAIRCGEDSTAKKMIDAVLEDIRKVADREEFKLNDEGTALVTKPWLKRETEDGYDPGGRHSSAENYAGEAMKFAFLYLMTGEEGYARVAYHILIGISEFEHWGPGHFLNCAQAACFSAITYDWLKDVWCELKLDTGAVKRSIFKHGIYQGYLSAIEDRSDFPSARQGTGWRFKAKPDNWNAVCNGGLITAILSLLGDGVDGVFTERELDLSLELLGCSLATMSHGELVLMQYAPDGSYVESNSYWSYGTESLIRAIGALYDALGTDLGLTLAGGLDKTCYYALNSESPDFVGWNYHDGSLGRQNTALFNVFATVTGDDTLYAIRRSQVEGGKPASLIELLYLPEARERAIPSLSALPLDSYMEGIDAFVVHGGWEKDSLYAGVMGGYNPKGGSHNQLDSGSFIYHRHGVRWITDMGPDNYNTKGGYFGNYQLYRRNAEGANVVCLPSITYGQGMDCSGAIIRHHSGKGALAVIDNSAVYEGKTSSALRGMLLTPDRETLVIQDEIDFTEPTDAFILAHVKTAEIEIALAEDGKSAILTHRDGAKVKISLRAEDGVRLTVRGCYDFILPTTANFEGEYDRSEYSRLVVEYKGAASIRCATVIEPVDKNGYPEFIPMKDWAEV